MNSALKSLISSCLALLLLGCATSGGFRAANRTNLLKLSVGMSRADVLEVMGIGEETLCCPLHKVTNPYRTEMYQSGDSRFEVLYYYTDRKTAVYNSPGGTNASVIQDEDLMPVVIKDSKLDGWGWSYWQQVVQKYEIRIRR